MSRISFDYEMGQLSPALLYLKKQKKKHLHNYKHDYFALFSSSIVQPFY